MAKRDTTAEVREDAPSPLIIQGVDYEFGSVELTAQSPADVPAPPTPAEAQLDAAKATPEEHARDTGNVRDYQESFKLNGSPGIKPAYTWQHAAAAQLHGWNAHKLHSAEPFTLTREAYSAALDAGATADERGHYTPHPGALSPFAPKSEVG